MLNKDNMDYEFSDIPLGQGKQRSNWRNRFGIYTAYGQLIALVFLPICVLAVAGGLVVLFETTKAIKAQQQAHAQAILSRYKPVSEKLLVVLETEEGRAKAQVIMQSMLIEHHLNRAALMDANGKELVKIGNSSLSWPLFDKKLRFIKDLPSPIGNVYGMNIGTKSKPTWLMIDLDNEPITIAHYRVWLALAITGLLTILLLLLFLNIYSKRWIAPVYEMRLHLQNTDHTNLYKPMHVVSSGELNMLQRDIVFLLRRLHLSYQELKEYAEQTEDDLRNAFDDMEIQTISIRSARDAAVMASEAKSAFLANISHELRTPLNSIDGFINLLARKHNLSAEQNMYVQTIKKSSAHLLALVNDVLDFSKIEAGKLILEKQEVDLYALIYDVVDMLTPLAAEKNINLSVFYYEDVPIWVISDELRCKQILTNLVSNALKFTTEGEVIVRVGLLDESTQNNPYSSEQIIISVQDTGAGVPAQDRQQLFKSFSQGDPSITRQFGGTGLGLVISKQLVHLLGGDIGYQDNVTENIANKGSTFWFSIPQGANLEQPKSPILSNPVNILANIAHESSLQVLSGLLNNMSANLTKATSTADLLDKLKLDNLKDAQPYDWVIVDGKDDLPALLRGIRENYRGKLVVYDYQVSLDFDLLKRYQVEALNQPFNRRELFALLAGTKDEETLPTKKWHGKHVLAVDDHMPNLMVLDALLAELDVAVTTVNSGFEAIETFNRKNLANEPYDLIFMDIQMPRMSGFEASEQIRAIEKKHQHVPIIALTAHALSDEKAKLLSAGVDDYMSKPISQPQLISVLKKWFDADKSPVAPSYGRLKALSDSSMLQAHAESDAMIQTNDLPLIDWQDALSRSANKQDLAKDILRMLLASLPQEKQQLQATWEMGDIEEVGQIAHRITGGTRYTGVPALRDVVNNFQLACLEQTEKPPEKAKIVLTEQYTQLINAIDNLIDIVPEDYPEIADVFKPKNN